MKGVAPIIVAAVFIGLLSLRANAISLPVSGSTEVEQQTKKLAKLLKRRGYAEVPLALCKTGLLDVKAKVDGVPMLLNLDTGANNINLDRASAERAKLVVKETEQRTSALGGTLQAGMTKIDRLSIKEVDVVAEAFVVDLSPMNAALKKRGDPPCDGVLGGSYLKHDSAVIAYAPPDSTYSGPTNERRISPSG